MDSWGYVVTQPAPPPIAAPRPRRVVPLRFLAPVTLALVAAAALTLFLYPRHKALPVVSDPAYGRPSGTQLPLTTSFTTKDPTGGPTYEIQLPEFPNIRSVSLPPGPDGSQNFGTAFIHGPQLGTLLMLKMPGRDSISTPQESLDYEASHVGGKDDPFERPNGPIHRIEIEGAPAYVLEFKWRDDYFRLREYRFARAGRIYGIGILYHPNDRVSLDTGLAAIQTLHWMS